MLLLREYQERSLESLAAYLRQTTEWGARKSFVFQTERPYWDVSGMAGLPYVCLRVPTGGGKTLMACHAINIAAKEYIHLERPVCLWLAPSNAIVNQTLDALKDRKHPYRKVLDAEFSGNVRVMDLTEALYVTKGDLDGAACIIVATLQALRVEDTDGRKVYEDSGHLMPHFSGLPQSVQDDLEKNGGGFIVHSLGNVLRIRRPLVIMDEAHNARTELSFDTLTRFHPACIIEFTATPQTRHDPDKGIFASNVLHHVSARELKEAEMVKLPIKLRTHMDWRQIISDALNTRRNLEKLAEEERKETGDYIRPIVLFQAQSVKGDDLNVATLKRSLLEDFKIPEEQIAIATGGTKEIKDVNLFDSACPVRFIITVRALVEGWDCPFAYVLCSVSEISTPRSVEQVLGRILRLPQARRKKREALNNAYAFAASGNFIQTAKSLQDALIEGAGFQRMEASDFVVPDQQTTFWDAGTLFVQASENVYEKPDLSTLDDGLRERVKYDENTGELTVKGVLSEPEMKALRQCFKEAQDQQAVERIFHKTQGQYIGPEPRKAKDVLRVPLLAIRIEGQFELFDDSHFLDIPWNLAEGDASLSEWEFPSEYKAGADGEIDVSDSGQVEMTVFVQELHQQLSLLTAEPGWTLPSLANWLDFKIPHPDIPRSQSSLFMNNVLSHLMESRGLEIDNIARHKFRLAKAVEAKIQKHREEYRRKAYQSLLFGDDSAAFEVSPETCLTYDEDRYSPNWYYEGGYRFQKHLFRCIGDLRNDGEEFDCAVFLDQMPEVKTWVRNLERRPESSFWLQTSTDRFYPDFVAELQDDRILVVEYKGEDRWSNDDSKEKRVIGNLWADRSQGKCLFVMPKGKDWAAIKAMTIIKGGRP
ncbi:MAG: DEAD/DEAH box helicase family protein [Thermodesulfobacteriota bacterium]